MHENLSCEPISDYNKTKLVTEKIIQSYKSFKHFIIRPSTLYGESPKMRLDLTLNILTMQAAKKGRITVHGGKQFRPYLHVNDMVDLYLHIIKYKRKIKQGIYNIASGNMRVIDGARLLKKLYKKTKIQIKNINDIRSYRVDSSKILRTGFKPKEKIEKAIIRMYQLFKSNKIKDKANFYSIYWVKKKKIK